jgi:hypothetical protein
MKRLVQERQALLLLEELREVPRGLHAERVEATNLSNAFGHRILAVADDR